MKFTIDWLKEHLETEAPTAEIIETLTMIGLEVEDVEDQGKALEAFVIGHVVSAEQHPNADRLRVCMVDIGTGEPTKVVCGAPNARTGMKGVFAATGTYIPGTDFTLKKGVIRGEESNGMLCSERELLLSDDHTGIIDLPDDAPIGASYAEYAGLGGVVIDIAITPNRGDCTGVYGIARDLAATGIGNLLDVAIMPVPSTGPSAMPALEQRFAEGEAKAIRKFAGRLIKGVKNGASPDWMQQRLIAIGLRPINALADITNFVSYGWGRPLHAYDADKVEGVMHLRNATPGEELDGLDGKIHKLGADMCVIADDKGPLCLGGILGGERSSCTHETTNIFMECASWDPELTARVGRATSIVSDARYRLERGVDPALTEPGLELATKLVLEICGGEPSEPVISGEDFAPDTIIDFPLSEIKRLTGLEVSTVEVKAILTRLGFWMSGSGDIVKIAVPSWRPDVTMKADIVEEVMRIVGVDRVPVDPLPRLAGVAPKMLTNAQNRRRMARRALAGRGLDEVVTWSFVSDKEAERFGGGDACLKLANPIASDLTDMRPSLLPGLIAAVRRNQNRGIADLALFEVGQVFHSDKSDGQSIHATAIRTGSAGHGGSGRHWQSAAKPVDVFDAKADLAALLDVLGTDLEKTQIVSEPAEWSHPGRGGRIQLGPKLILGWFGELHPALIADLDVSGPIVAFELNLDALPKPRKKVSNTKTPLSQSGLMPLSRDFAFVLDTDVAAARVIKAARSADRLLIKSVSVFDLFEGASLGEGKKSLAIEVTLQPRDKTLTEKEIETVSARIVAAVEKATGGELRR